MLKIEEKIERVEQLRREGISAVEACKRAKISYSKYYDLRKSGSKNSPSKPYEVLQVSDFKSEVLEIPVLEVFLRINPAALKALEALGAKNS